MLDTDVFVLHRLGLAGSGAQDLIGGLRDTTLTPASPKAARTATYRVAADVVCTVYCGTEELTRATLPLFEFGRDVELALPSKK